MRKKYIATLLTELMVVWVVLNFKASILRWIKPQGGLNAWFNKSEFILACLCGDVMRFAKVTKSAARLKKVSILQTII